MPTHRRLDRPATDVAFLLVSAVAACAEAWFRIGGVSVWFPAAAVTVVYLRRRRPATAVPVACATHVALALLVTGPGAPAAAVVLSVATMVGVYAVAAEALGRTTARCWPDRPLATISALIAVAAGAATTTAVARRLVAVLAGDLPWSGLLGRLVEAVAGEAVTLLSLAPALLLVTTDERASDGRLMAGVPRHVVALLVAAATAVAVGSVSAHIGDESLVLLATAPVLLCAFVGGLGGAIAANALVGLGLVISAKVTGSALDPLFLAAAVSTTSVSSLVAGAIRTRQAADAEAAVDARWRADLAAAELDLVIESSPVPMVVVDVAADQVLRANPAMVAFVGVPAEQLLGRSPFGCVEDDAVRQRLARGVLRRDPQAERVTTRLRTAQGLRIAELRVTPITATGLIVVQIADLTELVQAGEEVARQRDALETVAVRVAHDLRSPFTAIAGFADLLVWQGDQLDQRTRVELLGRIAASARSGSRLAAEVLEAARGAVSPEAQLTDLATALADIEAIHGVDIAERGAVLSADLRVEVAQAPATAVKQILSNLVANALRYRHPDRPLRIHVEARSRGGAVELSISDNGLGLPPGDPEELFRAGVRGADAAGSVVGTGLGLANARALARGFGGELTARTRRPAGARFTLTIPEDAPATPAAAPVAVAPPPAPAATELGTLVG